MEHYVCPVCKGVADHPKVCETKGCSREGGALKACSCADNKHEGLGYDAENSAGQKDQSGREGQ